MSIGCGAAGPRTKDGTGSRALVSAGIPASFATSTDFCGPILTLSCAKTVFTDCAVAFTRSITPKLAPSKFFTGLSKPGTTMLLLPVNVECKDSPPNLRTAIISVDPTNGAILAMYGGPDFVTRPQNAVTQDIAQAGSTFKPFTLIAALENGESLHSTFTGKNNMVVPGFDKPVKNFEGASFGVIDLVKATAQSVNTVFAQLNVKIGPDKSRDAAIRAGIPDNTPALDPVPSFVLGPASPHPIDMAEAYATIASGGTENQTFLVRSLTSLDGNSSVSYTHLTLPTNREV